MYDYKTKNKTNLKDSLPAETKERAQKLKAVLQASFYLKQNNLQGKPEPVTP